MVALDGGDMAKFASVNLDFGMGANKVNKKLDVNGRGIVVATLKTIALLLLAYILRAFFSESIAGALLSPKVIQALTIAVLLLPILLVLPDTSVKLGQGVSSIAYAAKHTLMFLASCETDGIRALARRASRFDGFYLGVYALMSIIVTLWVIHFMFILKEMEIGIVEMFACGIISTLFAVFVIALAEFTMSEQTQLPEDSQTEFTLENYSKTNLNSLKNLLREETGKTVNGFDVINVCSSKVKDLKEYTWEEIRKHDKANDLWIVGSGFVFDVTSYFWKHPGGTKILLTMAGRDCSDVLNEYHPDSVFKMLPKFLVGKLRAHENASKESQEILEASSSIVKDFRTIRQMLLSKKLFEADYNFYAKKAAATYLMLALGIYIVVYANYFAWRMLAAVLVGMVWQQGSFVAHDLGHTAVTHDRWLDNVLAIIAVNLTGGVSIGWWKLSHNVHHVNCNSENDDPDIQHMPLFAVSQRMLSSFFSTYHQKVFIFDPLSKFLVSYQHILFYPVMAVARVNLYIQSYSFFILHPYKINGKINRMADQKPLEILACGLFWAWYALLLSYVPSNERFFFFLISHVVSGILHVQICLSHFSMKTYAGQHTDQIATEISAILHNDNIEQSPPVSNEENWVLLQLNTSMNVANSALMDFVHGGLNYQIEHHLFPRLPRHNLRLVSSLVVELCSKHNITYKSLPFYEANVDMLSRLKEAAMEARKMPIDTREFAKTGLYDGLNLIG